jgi:hypothetical protein
MFMSLALASCGGDGTGPELPALNGSMTAVIDGVSWSATTALTAAESGGILGFAGSDASNVTIGMAFVLDGTGTYPIGPSIPTNATYTDGSSAQWSADPFNGSGSITVTTLTSDHAVGTFSFVMEPDAGNSATGSVTITAGTFDVTF